MKKYLFLLLCLLSFAFIHAQQSFTFDVEKLQPPEKNLPAESKETVLKKLLLKDAGINAGNSSSASITVDSVIVASYKASGSLVNYGYHSFFDGMYKAYAEHRPFILSPDIIWLLISQGFAQHVNSNAEALRSHFVKHDGKITLIVQNDKILLDDANSPWEEVFPEFTKKIAEYTGEELINTLTSNFSTTTPVSQIASQITIMDAMKQYFEYVVLVVGCGIPQITIEGTPADWKKLYQKTEALEKYDLGWWTKEIKPLLQEFINASEKKVNAAFWRNMFKYHENGLPYKSKSIDGWVIKFFPYGKNGKRNNLDSLFGSSNLPDEICKVDLLHVYINPKTGATIQTPLELCAGFMGLKQDDRNFTLKPEIGWYVKRKDSINPLVLQGLKEQNRTGTISIRANQIPNEILAIPVIKNLEVYFVGDIRIPQQMAKQKIETMILRGNITDAEAKKIRDMFPDTKVIINNGIAIITDKAELR